MPMVVAFGLVQIGVAEGMRIQFAWWEFVVMNRNWRRRQPLLLMIVERPGAVEFVVAIEPIDSAIPVAVHSSTTVQFVACFESDNRRQRRPEERHKE